MDAINTTQRIIPMLAYDDAPAALTFLRDAFGFEERFRMAMDDGRIGHAEIGYQDNIVCSLRHGAKQSMAPPVELSGVHSQVLCRVDNVDAHYETARAAGATIVAQPADQPYGERMYRAMDPEGHRWIFASPLAAEPAKP